MNDYSNPLQNQFTVVYDDVTLGHLLGEIIIRPNDSWKVMLKGNYYNYITMVREEHPWNKPQFDGSLELRYSMQDKIILDAGLNIIGSRYYQYIVSDVDATLPANLDVNLGLEYRYSKLLSLWIRFNNLAASPYYLYNNYPSYRIRVMVGFNYAL